MSPDHKPDPTSSIGCEAKVIRQIRSMLSVRKQPQDGRHRQRSFNGCVRCRKMKIKCNEAKPTCARCSRAGAECVYEMRCINHSGPITTTATILRSSQPKDESLSKSIHHEDPEPCAHLNSSTMDMEMCFASLFSVDDYPGGSEWISLIIEMPGKRKAMNSCLGALALCRMSILEHNPCWESQSLLFYSEAMQSIQQELNEKRHQWNEQTLVVIQILRFYECVAGSSPRNYTAHVAGAAAYLIEYDRQRRIPGNTVTPIGSPLVSSTMKGFMPDLIFCAGTSASFSASKGVLLDVAREAWTSNSSYRDLQHLESAIHNFEQVLQLRETLSRVESKNEGNIVSLLRDIETTLEARGKSALCFNQVFSHHEPRIRDSSAYAAIGHNAMQMGMGEFIRKLYHTLEDMGFSSDYLSLHPAHICLSSDRNQHMMAQNISIAYNALNRAPSISLGAYRCLWLIVVFQRTVLGRNEASHDPLCAPDSMFRQGQEVIDWSGNGLVDTQEFRAFIKALRATWLRQGLPLE